MCGESWSSSLMCPEAVVVVAGDGFRTTLRLGIRQLKMTVCFKGLLPGILQMRKKSRRTARQRR